MIDSKEKADVLIKALMDKCYGPEGLKKNPVTDNIILDEDLFSITGVSPSYINSDLCLDYSENVVRYFFKMIVHHYQEKGVGILENFYS